MRIIHCADIHLDSALNTNMIALQAKERRQELLRTWVGMVQYAQDNGVSVIVIAGDWFDGLSISMGTLNVVEGTIKKYSHIDFVYLPGNHDERACVDMLTHYPNFKLLEQGTNTFSYGRIVIRAFQKKLALSKDDINIVVAHMDMPDMEDLAGRHIDYLALGHIHRYMEGRIDARGQWCYCGCLEQRGFDESGRQGFVVLDIDEVTGDISKTLVRSGYRHVHSMDIQVTYEAKENGMDTVFICDQIAKALSNIPGKDMVKVNLRGELYPGDMINVPYIYNYFKGKFFGFRIEDLTSMVLDIQALSKERSLKGEFIRAVMASNETDDVKRRVIRCGLSALAGEVMD